MLQRLTSIAFHDARAEIFRLTFLRDVSGIADYAGMAAAQVLAIDPPNPDRLAAFMVYPWLSALTIEADRSHFTSSLISARLPEISARLARCASPLLPSDLRPRVGEKLQRVAVISPWLGDRTYPPGVMVANQCEVLAREGVEVYVFSCGELQVPDMSLFRGSHAHTLLAATDPQYWLNRLPEGTRLSVTDTRFSLLQRWRDILPAIAQFDPDGILLVGLYSPLAAALFAVRPVVGMSSHTLPPLAPLDVWLSADETLAPGPVAWSSAFPLPQVHFHPYRIKRPQGPWALTRNALGLAEDAVIWLTVGARLGQEISGAWAQRMIAELKRQPRVVWLLVGGNGELPPALAAAPAAQLRVLALRPDIGGILQLSDIYVNPPRMGGGFSVAEAMAAGLPVVSFADSDGGDKVGELALADPEAYMQRLAALTASPALRAEVGQALRARFDQRLDLAASGPSMLAAFERASAAASLRFSQYAS